MSITAPKPTTTTTTTTTPTSIKPTPTESLTKSVTRSMYAIASSNRNSIKVKDVIDDVESETMSLPVLNAFNPDKDITAEDLSASLLASGVYMVGLMSGMMAGLIMIYKWWMFLLVLAIFMVMTIISPKVTDSLVNGLMIAIQGLYLPFRHVMKGIATTMKPSSPHSS